MQIFKLVQHIVYIKNVNEELVCFKTSSIIQVVKDLWLSWLQYSVTRRYKLRTIEVAMNQL